MICKFCNAEVEDDQTVCPVCGKELTEEQAPEETVAQEPETEETVAVEAAEDVADQPVAVDPVEIPAEEQKKKRSSAPLVFSIIAAVLALASLAVLLLMALGVDFKALLPRANDIMNKDTYIVADDQAVKDGRTVIATIGDKQLTNAELQIYYRMQVVDFINYYGSYASQIGLDLTLPLSEQTCYFDEEVSWEQYLLDIALETWRSYQIMGLMAEDAGYVLEEQWQESLEEMPEELKKQAEEAEFDTVQALLEDVIGPACTEEDYIKYISLAYLCNAYYGKLSEQMTPSDAEVSAYFEENKAELEESGIKKDMGNIASVRHILISPEGGELDETTGLTTYSDDEWAACLDSAEKVLDAWKAGEATEESFAELANTHSADTGSNTTGGLYENIAPGDSYMEGFLNWAIDMNRKTGDTDIVQTDYGYHIMYYVSGEPYWQKVVASQQLSERVDAAIEAAENKWPAKINYRKIALSELELS